MPAPCQHQPEATGMIRRQTPEVDPSGGCRHDPSDAHAERLRRLDSMLTGLIRELAAVSGRNPTQAQHLAEAIIDLQVMIRQVETVQVASLHNAHEKEEQLEHQNGDD